jgi:maltooligosyltrehalose synthase
MTDAPQVRTEVIAAVVHALEHRRELVAFSRLEAVEMDQRARAVEREALERIRALLQAIPADQQLEQVQTRLGRMDEALQVLAARQDIQERSRALERDDITWRAFEDISWLLGIG